MTLWDEFISPENFKFAVARAVRGRRTKVSVAKFLSRAAENTERLRQMVERGEFRTSPYRTMEITDPKRRTISILPFYPDRIVHHAIMNVLGPRWESKFIGDAYAGRTGRGLHAASRRAMEFARKNRYVLKCDIRKFYPSIPHDQMMRIVKKHVDDAKMREILREIIYSTPGERGLPIGNLCSLWLGNLYMHELDMFVKRELGVKSYIRYCDDFCLFANDKARLAAWREKIRKFLAEKLQLNFSKSEIFPMKNGLDFVGYRHFPGFVLLRRRTVKKLKSRMREIGAAAQIDNIERARGRIAAAYGWMKFACSYNLRCTVELKKLARRVGIHTI